MRLQIEALEKYGVDGIFMEKASGKNMDRPEFKRMMNSFYTRAGDTIVVWKLDRLGRSLVGLIETVEEIQRIGAHFVCITDQIDTSTATGRFFFHIIAAMAEWERNMISERTKAGMAAAKAAGKRLGPRHSIKDNAKRMAKARALDATGELRTMLDRDLLIVLNTADLNAKTIQNIETVRRWRRDGYPGLWE